MVGRKTGIGKEVNWGTEQNMEISVVEKELMSLHCNESLVLWEMKGSLSHRSVLPLLSQHSKSSPVTCRQGTGMRQSIPAGRKNLASTIHMGFLHSPSQRSFIPFYCTWKRWSSYGFLMEQERKTTLLSILSQMSHNPRVEKKEAKTSNGLLWTAETRMEEEAYDGYKHSERAQKCFQKFLLKVDHPEKQSLIWLSSISTLEALIH